MTKPTTENSPWYQPGSIRRMRPKKATSAPIEPAAIDISFLADLDSSDIDRLINLSFVQFGGVCELYGSPTSQAGVSPEPVLLDEHKIAIWRLAALVELHARTLTHLCHSMGLQDYLREAKRMSNLLVRRHTLQEALEILGDPSARAELLAPTKH